MVIHVLLPNTDTVLNKPFKCFPLETSSLQYTHKHPISLAQWLLTVGSHRMLRIFVHSSRNTTSNTGSEICNKSTQFLNTIIKSENTGSYNWPRDLRRRSAAAWLLGSKVRIPLRAWMFVSGACCVLCRYQPVLPAYQPSRGVLGSGWLLRHKKKKNFLSFFIFFLSFLVWSLLPTLAGA